MAKTVIWLVRKHPMTARSFEGRWVPTEAYTVASVHKNREEAKSIADRKNKTAMSNFYSVGKLTFDA